MVALSGGKDSTALALALKERNPRIDYTFYCTPTANELPEMFDWWKRLGEMLGKPIRPIMEMTLESCIETNKALPNHRMRFCTRQIKIEPVIRLFSRLVQQGEVHSYVGLRADEEGRAGGSFDEVADVQVHFPLREWGWKLKDVRAFLASKGVQVPERTDCALCFHQRIGEWWRLWANHPHEFAKGIDLERKYGATFRSPGRDSWPLSLENLAKEFEKGNTPKGERQLDLFCRGTMNIGSCRICSL
jgi:3'-phosphoadenosine 5'-phosphosulfate sulfotransferase (PAPS reductase)/FAD synthetase